MRNEFKIMVVKPEDNSENLGVDGRIIFKWILRE
jgi:hypothetical protein